MNDLHCVGRGIELYLLTLNLADNLRLPALFPTERRCRHGRPQYRSTMGALQMPYGGSHNRRTNFTTLL